MPSFGKKVLSPDFKESEDAEIFDRNSQVCLRAISWIWEWVIFFFHWYVDKRKQKSKPLQKETLQSFVLTYLQFIESFCDLLCDIYV